MRRSASGISLRCGTLGLGLLICLLETAAVRAQNSAILPAQAIIGYSLDWLAPSGKAEVLPDKIAVYSLGCGKCAEELAAISQGYEAAPGRFMFAAFRSKDRAATIPLLAYGVAESDPKKRRSTFLDLMKIFTQDPDHYLNNLEDWETLISSYWPAGSTMKTDTISRAFAANILDMQVRILAMMDKLGTPNQISLDRPATAPPVKRGSDRYNALVASLSLSWLRPRLESMEDTRNIVSRARAIDPNRPYSQAEWRELKEWALGGAYWLWGGQLSPEELEAIADWQAQYHLLPSGEQRLARQEKWFDDAIAKAARAPVRPIEAFGLPDIDALASPAWEAAQDDARQQLVLASYLGGLTIDESK